MALDEDLLRIARSARSFASPDEELAAIIPTEPARGLRLYLCAYGTEGEDKSWLVLDEEAKVVGDRVLVRDAVSIAAMCEVAEEAAGGGHLEELRSQLVSLRVTENPPGIEEAEEAALALERTIGAVPRLASPTYLDEVGVATRRLEEALGELGRSPFVEALKAGVDIVEELRKDVESNYRGVLV